MTRSLTEARDAEHRGFTGRHMLAIMLAFFAVVIAANVTMATVAGWSWTGFVVRNSYVASQEFNGKVAAARAQLALGWTATLGVEAGEARLTLRDAQGREAPIRSATLSLRNPADELKDRTIPLERVGSGFQAALPVGDGQWVIEIVASTADGGAWRETQRIVLVDGGTR